MNPSAPQLKVVVRPKQEEDRDENVNAEDLSVIVAICPFCNGLLYLHEDTYILDNEYSYLPLFFCEHCCAKSFLSNSDYDSIEDLWLLVGENNFDKVATEAQTYFARLLWIERFTDATMYDHYVHRALTDEEVKKLLDSNYSKVVKNELKVSRQENNIPLVMYEEYNFDPAKIGDKEYMELKFGEETYMNISVPVHSYDLNKPAIKYPDGVSTAHDGIVTYVRVRNQEGQSIQTLLCGD